MRTNSIALSRGPLSRSDKYYLRKTTKFTDKIWVYFTSIEDDFRLLHMTLAV